MLLRRQQVLPFVCRRWRDICRSNPSIHTHVSLLARGRTAPAFVEEYLSPLLPHIEHLNMQAAFAKVCISSTPRTFPAKVDHSLQDKGYATCWAPRHRKRQ